jgi:hypothetical protein
MANINLNRNKYIGKLLDGERLSYEVIAEMTGTTRNVVAGIAFRRRHPGHTRTSSPGSTGKPNKMGHGWQPPSYYPEKTSTNTR